MIAAVFGFRNFFSVTDGAGGAIGVAVTVAVAGIVVVGVGVGNVCDPVGSTVVVAGADATVVFVEGEEDETTLVAAVELIESTVLLTRLRICFSLVTDVVGVGVVVAGVAAEFGEVVEEVVAVAIGICVSVGGGVLML